MNPILLLNMVDYLESVNRNRVFCVAKKGAILVLFKEENNRYCLKPYCIYLCNYEGVGRTVD